MSVTYLTTDRMKWADGDGRHPDALNTSAANVATGAVECHPLHCANGHLLLPPNYRGSWLPCTCAGPEESNGHRVVGCGRCGHEWFYPPHADPSKAVSQWARREAVKCWCMGNPTVSHRQGIPGCRYTEGGDLHPAAPVTG